MHSCGSKQVLSATGNAEAVQEQSDLKTLATKAFDSKSALLQPIAERAGART